MHRSDRVLSCHANSCLPNLAPSRSYFHRAKVLRNCLAIACLFVSYLLLAPSPTNSRRGVVARCDAAQTARSPLRGRSLLTSLLPTSFMSPSRSPCFCTISVQHDQSAESSPALPRRYDQGAAHPFATSKRVFSGHPSSRMPHVEFGSQISDVSRGASFL